MSHYDQIKSFAELFANSPEYSVEVFIQGNCVFSFDVTNRFDNEAKRMLAALNWFGKCRWLATHFKINPTFPEFAKISKEQFETVDELYELLTQSEIVSPTPLAKATFVTGNAPEEIETAYNSEMVNGGVLSYTLHAKTVDLFGCSVPVKAISCQLTEMMLESKKPLSDGGLELVFQGTEQTTQTTKLLP